MRWQFIAVLLATACSSPRSSRLAAADGAEPGELGDEGEASGVRGGTTSQILDRAGAQACPGELGGVRGFRCLARREALDHFHPGGKQITVTFAVHPATKQPARGVLLNIDGGPGYAGLDSADNYLGVDKRITEQFDIVWFDLRGVGRSGGMDCKAAARAFYAGGLRVASPAEETLALGKAKSFAEACVAEMIAGGHGALASADLPFYNTRQAAEDLDDFRAFLQAEKLSIYGLSYGTQLAQTYVRFHPQRVERLILDGVVDLSLDHLGFQTSLNRGNLKLLDFTFSACGKSPACTRAFAGAGGTPAAAFTRALRFLGGAAPLALRSTPKLGALTPPRLFGRRDFDAATFNSLGHAETRRDWLRALPAAARGDFGPMLDASYAAAGVDPKTAGPVSGQGADPDMSDGIYYTVTCNDYGTVAPAEYMARGRAEARADDRVLSPFFGDLPCAFWPGLSAQTPPGPLAAAGIPTMIVSATGDAQTPVDIGEAVFANLEQGHRVLFTGGHHVMYGSGSLCGDVPITDFLLGQEVAASTACDDLVLAAGSFMPKKRGKKHRTY